MDGSKIKPMDTPYNPQRMVYTCDCGPSTQIYSSVELCSNICSQPNKTKKFLPSENCYNTRQNKIPQVKIRLLQTHEKYSTYLVIKTNY